MLKKDLENKVSELQNLLRVRTFAENSRVRINKRDVDFSELEYNFSEDDLDTTEILEIANDNIVKSNIQQITVDLLKYPKIWNWEESNENVNSYVEDLFNESAEYYIDWEKYSTQSTAEKIKFGWVDFYLKWTVQRTLEKIIPLNQEFTTIQSDGKHYYNDARNNFLIENDKRFATEFIQVKFNDDARSRQGKTLFNRQMLNYVRFKKRLVILQDLALDKAAIPAVIAMMDKTVQEQYDITNTSTTATNGLVAFKALIDTVSTEMADLSSGNGVALTGVDKVQALSNNINPDMFSKFKAMADEELAIAILATAKTTQQSNKGSRASDEVGLDIQDSIKQQFARLIQREINNILKIIVEVKFGKDTITPSFKFDFRPEIDTNEILNAWNSGLPIKKEALPEYIYSEIDKEEYLQKQQPQSMPFNEKKKITKPKVTLF